MIVQVRRRLVSSDRFRRMGARFGSGNGDPISPRSARTRQPMTATTDPDAEPAWSPRESELLGVALGVLQEHGYHGLTVEAVAVAAHASKATVYRRWPSKSELILAAVSEGTRQNAVAPNTGTLRGDLLCLGQIICEQGREHAGTIRAVLVEMSCNPALNNVMQDRFLHEHRALVWHVLQQAIRRGEIGAAAVNDELYDLLPGYLIFRCIFSDRPPTPPTIEALVDKALLPRLISATE